MSSKGIKFLKSHEADSNSEFEKDALWEQENEDRLRKSRKLATSLINYMQLNNLTKSDIAIQLGVSIQYISRLLSCRDSLSLEELAKKADRLEL